MVAYPPAVVECELPWQDEPAQLNLGDNEIHLWMIDLGCFKQYPSKSDCIESLSSREKQRSSRIKDDEKRALYIGGRVGLRVLLERYTGIRREQLSFNHGDRGKPYLDITSAPVHFNYTVSSGYALYGFSRGFELGVDLEIFPRIINVAQFESRILSMREWQSWQCIPEYQQNNAMLSCWTRKEAYGKLLGVGIRYTMNEVDLFIDLHTGHWQSKVSGLFGNESTEHIDEVNGIQIGLPLPGAAALVYAGTRADNTSAPPSISKPSLMAYKFF